ncbi:hypothetical protein DdX_11219 [Ditylenchus destructor]|uniref:Uncharacterized protein n=1 Tax=Ditylenchus destructor TaxID=166010 RepID=A0AAD4R4Q9_9BILA|nr:hypothetical protein DdX_11219 [Ditylenchus destructor]
MPANIFRTAKGNITIGELMKKVFTPNGYALVDAEKSLIPVLKQENPPTCKQAFEDWERQAEKGISTASNPQLIAVYYATKFHSIKGMNGAVIGSQTPWVEVLCLANGAESLITVDYQKLHITHPQIAFIHAMDVVKNREVYNDKFDFIVSFSSIEHSGLGRYGDPIDPFGDIKEMQKIRCMLKPGGLFFLGLPVGQDNVGWNCHRTYGRIRLAMMTAGFEVVDIFYMDEEPINLELDMLYKEYYNPHVFIHYVFVLRKSAPPK